MTSLLSLECIALDVRATGPEAVFRAIGAMLGSEHGLKAGEVTDRLLRRESRRSTGLGWGMALPHADASGLGHSVAAFVRTREPIPFAAPDGRPVHNILALIVPRPATAGHHDLLTRYSRLLCRADFRQLLDRCEDASSVWRLFDEHLRW